MPPANANTNATTNAVIPPVVTANTVATVSTAQMIQNSAPFFEAGLGLGLALLIPITTCRFFIKRIYK